MLLPSRVFLRVVALIFLVVAFFLRDTTSLYPLKKNEHTKEKITTLSVPSMRRKENKRREKAYFFFPFEACIPCLVSYAASLTGFLRVVALNQIF